MIFSNRFCVTSFYFRIFIVVYSLREIIVYRFSIVFLCFQCYDFFIFFIAQSDFISTLFIYAYGFRAQCCDMILLGKCARLGLVRLQRLPDMQGLKISMLPFLVKLLIAFYRQYNMWCFITNFYSRFIKISKQYKFIILWIVV